MARGAVRAIWSTFRGIGRAIRGRPGVFAGFAVGVFAFNLVLPLAVLSVFRRPVDFFTFNPWLSRLPEWLASDQATLGKKLDFLSQMAIAWFSADSPVEGVEWGFILDVPTLSRFLLTALLFGTYFALWFYRRDQVRACGWAPRVSRHGGMAGAVTSVLGFTSVPCSVAGCGVPVLPVVGMALTGVSTTTLRFFSETSRIAIAVVLIGVALGVAYYGWLVGTTEEEARRG